MMQNPGKELEVATRCKNGYYRKSKKEPVVQFAALLKKVGEELIQRLKARNNLFNRIPLNASMYTLLNTVSNWLLKHLSNQDDDSKEGNYRT